MRKLSLNILFLFLVLSTLGQENPHGKSLAVDCADCHTTKSWKYSETSGFNHNSTKFILEGQHIKTSCSACHTSLVFTEAKTECIDCHADMHNTTVGPDCALCHDANSWIVENITELHQQSRFPLLGAHIMVDCSSCHTSASQLEFEPLGVECVDCHQQDYLATTDPDHVETGLSTDCIECHEVDAFDWSASGISHGFFPLTLGHDIADCTACHSTDLTEPLSPECYSCHSGDYNEAENHALLGYPFDCEQCHSIATWDESSFYHSATNFPLTGAHAVTECIACHEDGYTGLPTECSACHTNNYNGAKDPNHTAAGISTECETCHETSDWVPSIFDHNATTGFDLTGGHNNRQCSDCHQGNTSGASSDCISCHSTDYKGAKNHLALDYPYDCLLCHNTSVWDNSTFDHNATSFPLTGSHKATECTACHADGYAGTPIECSACHINKYNEAQDPDHIAAGISDECEDCHGTNNWVPSTFNHSSTGFPLTGGHVVQQCSDCHQGTTSGASSDCVSCHLADYNGAKDHVPQNFPLDCTLCHNTVNWGQSTFDHNATSFPLTGSHVATECIACHSQGYTGTSSLCSDCHQTEFNNSTNPNHASIGLSNQCDDCHSTGPEWYPALMPNHDDYYVLSGAHAAVADNCYLCHAGDYNNTPTDCFDCHNNDYTKANKPKHATAEFSTDCELCHTIKAWKPSSFDHDSQFFPIYSGEHRGEWNTCTDCHTEPSNYSSFSCTTCHDHNRLLMYVEHNDVADYSFNSTSCFECHPTGKAE